MKKVKSLIFLLLTIQSNSFSQCAMCKATAESSGAASGLNEGIIYLMFIPYILLGAFLVFIFRKKIIPFWRELIGKGDKKEINLDNWY